MKVTVEAPNGEIGSVEISKNNELQTDGLPDEIVDTLQSIKTYQSVERVSAEIPQSGLLTGGERYSEASLSEKAQRVEEFFVSIGWEVTGVSEE